MFSQSVEYSMRCVNYAQREQEKPLLFKLTLRSRSTLSQARSDTCHELLVVFGLSTLNSNRTNHKPRKKLANQKRRHMSLRLCGTRTRYCALIRRRSIQKVQSVCDAGNKKISKQKMFDHGNKKISRQKMSHHGGKMISRQRMLHHGNKKISTQKMFHHGSKMISRQKMLHHEP